MAQARIQVQREYQFNSTSPSFSFETQDGANRLLVVLVPHRSIGTITGMTLDGTAMTPIFTATGTGTGSARRAVAGYYMIAPPVGVKTLAFTYSSSDPLTIRCFGIVDAHQTAPFRDQGSGALAQTGTGSTSTGSTLSLVTQADDLCLDCLCLGVSSATAGAGQILLAGNATPVNRSSSVVATGTSTDMAWTYASATYAHAALAVVGSAATQPSPANYTGSRGKRTWILARHSSTEALPSGGSAFAIGVTTESGAVASSSDASDGIPWRTAGVMSHPAVYVTTNACTNDTTITLVDNGSLTSCSITIPAGVTGWVSGTGTASMSGSTPAWWYAVRGNSTFEISTMLAAFEPTGSDTITIVQTYSSAYMEVVSDNTRYVSPMGSRGSFGSTDEAPAQMVMQFAGTWDGLFVQKAGNTVTGEVNAYSRVNGVNGNQTCYWPGSSTANQEDTTHSDTLADQDRINWQFVIAPGSGTGWQTEKWSSRLRNSNGEFLTRCATSAESTGAGVPNGVSYGAIGGEMAISVTRSVVEMPVPAAFAGGLACKRLYIQLASHTGDGTCLVELLINGSAGTQYIQLQPRSDTLYYCDFWHVDSGIAAGDGLCLRFTNNASSNTIRVKAMGIVGIERAAGVPVDLAGTPTGQSTATGGLDHSVPLAGSAAVQASASAGLSHGVPLAGTAQGQASASGTLAGGAGLAGSAGAQGSASGDLTHGVPLAGNAQGQGSAGGTLDGGASLSGNASGQAGASGALTHGVALSGNAQGQAGASGNLATSGSVGLSGSAQGNASATGGLTVPSSDFPGLTAWPGVRNAPLRSKAEPVPIVAPAAEPISLLEARQHLKIDDTNVADDALIAALIVAARQRAEHETGRRLITQVWDLVLDGFPPASQAIELSSSLIQAQSIVQINYLDAGGVVRAVPLDAFALDAFTLPGYVIPRDGHAWPADAAGTVNSVRVRVACGYGALPNDVPMAIRQWILLQLGAMYEHREAFVTGKSVAELPAGFVDRLLDPYRVWTL